MSSHRRAAELLKRAQAVVVLCLLVVGHAASAQDRSWRVGLGAFGPVRIGMTQSEVEAAVGGRLKAVYPDAASKRACYYLYFPRQSSGVTFMMMNRRLARIGVADTQKVATSAGAKIGDSEESVKTLYANRLTVTPHYYIRPAGHYLTVVSKDRRHAIRFETDGEKVVSYSTGTPSAVRLVEGCS